MADTKITDLAALTGAGTAAGDVFVVVDVSDATMAASGTDKKITKTELLNVFEAAGAAAAAQAASQPLDSDLTAIAALSPSNDDIVQRKAGAWTNRTIAQLLTDLGLGALYQPLDSDLTSIAALTTTSYGRAFLELANQAATMGLLSAASATASGIVELATSAEVATGTDTTRAVTPAGIAINYQPLDADLTFIAALSTTSIGRSLLAAADAAAIRAIDGSIAGIRVEDEGSSTVAVATALNFVGSGVAVTDAGSGEATVTISGGSSDPLDGNSIIVSRMFAR